MRKLFILIALNAVFLSSCDNNKSASANEPIVDSITQMKYAFAEAYIDNISFVGSLYSDPSDDIEFGEWERPHVHEIDELANYSDPQLLEYLDYLINELNSAESIGDSIYLFEFKEGNGGKYAKYKNGKIKLIDNPGHLMTSKERDYYLSKIPMIRDKVQANIQGQ